MPPAKIQSDLGYNQDLLDGIIKVRSEATLARRVPLLEGSDVFAGLKARHEQRRKRAA